MCCVFLGLSVKNAYTYTTRCDLWLWVVTLGLVHFTLRFPLWRSPPGHWIITTVKRRPFRLSAHREEAILYCCLTEVAYRPCHFVTTASGGYCSWTEIPHERERAWVWWHQVSAASCKINSKCGGRKVSAAPAEPLSWQMNSFISCTAAAAMLNQHHRVTSRGILWVLTHNQTNMQQFCVISPSAK